MMLKINLMRELPLPVRLTPAEEGASFEYLLHLKIRF